MRVIKRDGRFQDCSFDKITLRIKLICDKIGSSIDPVPIAQKVITYVKDLIHTSEIDEVTARILTGMSTIHPDYAKIGSTIIISNLHKNTLGCFSDKIEKLYKNRDSHGKLHSIVTKKMYTLTMKNKSTLNKMIDYERDFLIDYFGFKTLEKSYLLRINKEESVEIVERPQDIFLRVSLSLYGDNMELVEESYNLMSNKYFTHATPTLFNAGTPREQLASCFLLSNEDSIENIYKCISDCAQISKWSGGIGIGMSTIRGKGSLIRGTNGRTNGIVPMLKVFNETALYVNQGGKRNGSIAVYLEPHHTDFFDFLDIRKNHGDEMRRARDLFIAVWISDLFMDRVKANGTWSLMCPDKCPGLSDVYGDEYKELYERYESEKKYNVQIPAREVWKAIITSQIETGTPYIMNKDAVNHCNNQKNVGVIRNSNLCVAPETLILTDSGHKTIKEICGKNVSVWNGKEYSDVEIVKTGENQKLMKVNFSDGSELVCTPYHKFYIQDGYLGKQQQDPINSKHVRKMEARELEPDMKLIKCNFPVIEKKNKFESAYTHGVFCGDGTYSKTEKESDPCTYKSIEGQAYCKRHISHYPDSDNTSDYCLSMNNSNALIVSLYDEKIKLLKHLDYVSTGQVINGKLNVILPRTLKEKYFVPTDYSIKSRMEWFSGYADADGCIVKNGETNQSLQICSIHKEFLMNIKLMLQECGVNTNVSSIIREKSLLADGNGGKRFYDTKPQWRLLVASCELQRLMTLGFNPNRLIVKQMDIQRNSRQFNTVVSTEELKRTDDTYCFNEPLRNAGIFNGVIAGNCAEIVEFSSTKEYAVCTLASICLPKFVENGTFDHQLLYTVVRQVTRNLNRVIDINYYPVKETKTSNNRHRPIGVGVQGLADVYLMLKLPYDSDEARKINKEIFETIYFAGLSESNEIAKKDGVYESYSGSPLSNGKFQFEMWRDRGFPVELSGMWDWESLRANIAEHGVRNSLITALMPTASTSQIMGNTESFEPITANIYTRKTIAGDFIVINKFLLNELIGLDLWNESVKDNLLANNGSIQSISTIPDEIKKRYKTVWEIKQRNLIDQSADRAPFICQSQSLNLYFSNPQFNKIHSALLYANDRGLKTLSYYTRTQAASEAVAFTIPVEAEPECVSCSG
jgi:ribonucleoside-diphosphate reductase alpha chain